MKIWKNTNTLDQLKIFEKSMNLVKVEEAEIAVIGGKKLDIKKMPKLKGIFKCGVGVDNIPFEEAEKRKIKICLPSEKTKKIIYEETANFTTYLIMRMIYDGSGNFKSWHKESRRFLKNLTVLVIGHGNIGKRVSKKMSVFTDVLKFDTLHNSISDLKKLMNTSDIISLHIPLTAESEGFIDKEKLSWMKDGAALVNTSRGPIVDEDALFNEISSGRIKGAFDVFWEEPYSGKMSNFKKNQFLMTPHVSSTCKDFVVGLGEDLKEFISELEKNKI